MQVLEGSEGAAAGWDVWGDVGGEEAIGRFA